MSRGHQAHGHPFAVPDLVATDLLDGVPEGMAQVEHLAPAAFEGIGLNHVSLDQDGGEDQGLGIGDWGSVGGRWWLVAQG